MHFLEWKCINFVHSLVNWLSLKHMRYHNEHDDVIKWKHIPRYWPFVRGIHRSPVNSPHKGQWHRALMFTLICPQINSWVNNCKAGDLRRNRAHYDVIVMIQDKSEQKPCMIDSPSVILNENNNNKRLGQLWDMFTFCLGTSEVPEKMWTCLIIVHIFYHYFSGVLISTNWSSLSCHHLTHLTVLKFYRIFFISHNISCYSN